MNDDDDNEIEMMNAHGACAGEAVARAASAREAAPRRLRSRAELANRGQ